MHIALWTLLGLATLALVFGATLLIRRFGSGSFDGPRYFIWFWLAAALVNGYNGWANHGIPLLNEIAAFVPIFGVPAAVAWYLSRRDASL